MPSDKATKLYEALEDCFQGRKPSDEDDYELILIDKALAEAYAAGQRAMKERITGLYHSGGGGVWNLDETFVEELRSVPIQPIPKEGK